MNSSRVFNIPGGSYAIQHLKSVQKPNFIGPKSQVITYHLSGVLETSGSVITKVVGAGDITEILLRMPAPIIYNRKNKNGCCFPSIAQ